MVWRRRERHGGRKAVLAGLLGAGLGLLLARVLHRVVDNTPMLVTPEGLFWVSLLLGCSGAVGGMALEAVRQLQAQNPNPEYHQHDHRRG